MTLRCKSVKVQPIEVFNLKRQSEDLIESEDSLQLQLPNRRLSFRYLHSIPEERLKGTAESSKRSLQDNSTQHPVSIERIYKGAYSLRVLAVFLMVASNVFLTLNI